jgi:MoxR-like ATPase
MSPESVVTHYQPIEVKKDELGVFVRPTEDPHYVVSEPTRMFFRAVELLSKKDKVVVGVRGPKGAGKTSLGEWFATVTKRPLFIQDIPTLREPKELLGYKDVETDPVTGAMRILWRLSGFVEAIQTPRACIVLDEATRVQAQILNILLPLLDHRGRVYVDDVGKTIHVAEGVVFIATANIGLQYTGTWQWDAAFEDRLQYQLDVGYLPVDVEAQVLTKKTGIDPKVAVRLAEIAELTRQRTADENDPLSHEISTRQLINAARLIAEGADPKDALDFTVVPTYSTEGGHTSHRTTVLQMIQGKLGS